MDCKIVRWKAASPSVVTSAAQPGPHQLFHAQPGPQRDNTSPPPRAPPPPPQGVPLIQPPFVSGVSRQYFGGSRRRIRLSPTEPPPPQLKCSPPPQRRYFSRAVPAHHRHSAACQFARYQRMSVDQGLLEPARSEQYIAIWLQIKTVTR